MSILLLLALSTSPVADLPQEVESFVADRNACDHFRGEPTEGDSQDQKDRRAFVLESLEIYCSGTDRRLAALKARYSSNQAVMSVLGTYEPAIEGPRCGP
jgi:hypothetical protein